MTQWDIRIAKALHITRPLAYIYGAIGRAQARLGRRGAVLSLVAIWHAFVGITLIGYTFVGTAYELLDLLPEWSWAALFLLSSGWAGGSAMQRQGQDSGGFYMSAAVTMLWGVWLATPALWTNGDIGAARSGGAFIVIGGLLCITGGWRER